MIRGIHHASITTANLDRLVRFYCDLLGFEVALDFEWGVGNEAADRIYGLKDSAVRMAMLKTGNAFLELFEFANPVGKPGDPARPVCDQGYTHICIAVTDIEAEFARLSAAGMHFNCPPQHLPGLCKATYGRDPDGNIVELMEPDPTGAFAF
jgi:catechol 2,3-dioxygenase-like lactoylglutathione lyase family enzyme